MSKIKNLKDSIAQVMRATNEVSGHGHMSSRYTEITYDLQFLFNIVIRLVDIVEELSNERREDK